MFQVYILKLVNGKLYIGQTNNLEKRLRRHQTGQCMYTKPFRPVKMVYHEVYETRQESVAREKYLKSLKSHEMVAKLIK